MLNSTAFLIGKRLWPFSKGPAKGAANAADKNVRRDTRGLMYTILRCFPFGACRSKQKVNVDGPRRIYYPVSVARTRFFLFILAIPAMAQTAYKPLTNQERWHRYWKETLLSPYLLAGSAIGVTGAQIRNDPPDWGRSAEGYGKRTLSYFGVLAVKTTIWQGSAAAMGYDPRYLKCDCRGLIPRTRHAILWTFLTKDSNGATRLNLPLFAGAYGSGILSKYWYPSRYSPLEDGIREGSRQVGVTLGVDILREFSPEIKRAIHFKR